MPEIRWGPGGFPHLRISGPGWRHREVRVTLGVGVAEGVVVAMGVGGTVGVGVAVAQCELQCALQCECQVPVV